MKRRIATLSLLAVFAVSACAKTVDITGIADLPEVTTDDVVKMVGAAGEPAVINVWASWCGPCRSEAPLLASAADRYDGEVSFIGLNVRDSQTGAKEFIAQFLSGAAIEHISDRDGSVVADLGGSSGVPLTFFVAADGSVGKIHFGVIDERTLALEIDELVRTDG